MWGVIKLNTPLAREKELKSFSSFMQPTLPGKEEEEVIISLENLSPLYKIYEVSGRQSDEKIARLIELFYELLKKQPVSSSQEQAYVIVKFLYDGKEFRKELVVKKAQPPIEIQNFLMLMKTLQEAEGSNQ